MTTVSAKEFGAKYACKVELERFLRGEVKAYLPDHKHITIALKGKTHQLLKRSAQRRRTRDQVLKAKKELDVSKMPEIPPIYRRN